MKKLSVLFVALIAVMAFSSSAFAANEVQMTLTSPTITKQGCEKAGSVAFAFDQETQIVVGDWWYIDLPSNVTICEPINYCIVGSNVGTLDVNTSANLAAGEHSGIFSVPSDSLGDNTTSGGGDIYVTTAGPVFCTSVTGGSGTRGAEVIGNVALRVYGVDDRTDGEQTLTGSTGNNMQRILISVVGSPNGLINVNTGFELFVKILDGAAHNTADRPQDSMIIIDQDGDAVDGVGDYGETADAIINPDGLSQAPHVENTLCVNAESYEPQKIFVSYASKLDKFTFTGDAEIAHVGPSVTVTLEACPKLPTTGNIEPASQGGVCAFDYETSNGYCPDFLGNKFLIQADGNGGFGPAGDLYDISAEILTDDVYFNGDLAISLHRDTSDPCSGDIGTPVATGTIYYVNGVRNPAATLPGSTCAIGNDSYINMIATEGGSFTLDEYDTVEVNLPTLVYENPDEIVGTEVQVELTLLRYPCGTVFQGERTIGTFVAVCDIAVDTTLYFPWFPGSQYAGWWGGYAITNFGTGAGQIDLIYRDSNGNQATYTVANVVPGAMWVNDAMTLADLVDANPNAPFDGTLNYSVEAQCGFFARGFMFTGNGTEGVGSVLP